MSKQIVEELQQLAAGHGCPAYRTGSREICDPAPTTTDEDFLVLDEKGTAGMLFSELSRSWYIEGDFEGNYEDCNNFWSMRKGSVNVILCTSKEFYDKFVLATQVAKKLNLLEKADRVLLFQAILYGRYYA